MSFNKMTGNVVCCFAHFPDAVQAEKAIPIIEKSTMFGEPIKANLCYDYSEDHYGKRPFFDGWPANLESSPHGTGKRHAMPRSSSWRSHEIHERTQTAMDTKFATNESRPWNTLCASYIIRNDA